VKTASGGIEDLRRYMELNKIYNMDCLEGSKDIESGSADLILTDLPYGNMKDAPSTWDKTKTEWDTIIEPKKVYDIANRLLRKNGKMVLFSQEPYTSRLTSETIPNVPFSYRMIWEKDNFANALLCKKAPVSYFEDILIFSKTHDMEGIHPLRLYFKDVLDYIGLCKKEIVEKIGQKADHTFRTDSTQYGLCTEITYNELIESFGIDNMEGFKTFKELKAVDDQFKRDLPSTFNLWEGKKYKSNILKYKKDYGGLHPTQKPVLLIEDLIKTFSNTGDLVVDLTIGSGTTAIAVLNTGRFFIGFELDKGYFDIANRRIEENQAQVRLCI
jgi:site-specific DNA-methyltransferase (adenine-specific)